MAAGVGAGVGSYVGGKLGTTSFSDPLRGLSAGNIASHALSGAASSIANAATRSAIEGSSFGRNIQAAIPDVIGSTIGNIIGGAVGGGGNALAKIERAYAQANDDTILVTAENSSGKAKPATNEVDEARLRDIRDNSPLTDKERAFIKQNNLFEERKINLPKAKEKLADAVNSLKEGQVENISGRKLIKRLEKIDERRHEVNNIENRITKLLSIFQKGNDYISTQQFSVRNAEGGYDVRDFENISYGFDTAELAVDHAIAFGFAQQIVFGDNLERGGFIFQDPTTGKFRSTNKLGTEVNTAIQNYTNSSGVQPYQGINIGTPFVPSLYPPTKSRNAVGDIILIPKENIIAQWHIHPRNLAGNSNFSSTDITSFNDDINTRENNPALPKIRYYLGGSDLSKDLYYRDSDGNNVRDNGRSDYFKY